MVIVITFYASFSSFSHINISFISSYLIIIPYVEVSTNTFVWVMTVLFSTLYYFLATIPYKILFSKIPFSVSNSFALPFTSLLLATL